MHFLPGPLPFTQPYKSSEVGAAGISQDVAHCDLKRLCRPPAPGYHHGLQNTEASEGKEQVPPHALFCPPAAKDQPGKVTGWPREWDGRGSTNPMPEAPPLSHQVAWRLRKTPWSPAMELPGP